MADPVLERDLQEMGDLESELELGVESARAKLTWMICHTAEKLTKWQWIIHGDTLDYRKVVVRWLCLQEKWNVAKRFAMCGRGDLGFNEFAGDGVKVVPMGCGCRFCPRCSRRCGRRFLSRVSKHLASREHGSLWHVVLTQRVQRSETLEEARDRFGKAWKRFYPRLRRSGMESALCTYHVTASLDGGWHYHCHLLVEWRVDVDACDIVDRVSDDWHWAKRDSGDSRMEVFSRQVVGAGPAIVEEAAEKQGEFWKESDDPVMAALQYVVRDVLQGVEKWVGKIKNLEDAGSFAEALGGSKLHRLYGAWRRQLPKVEAAAAADETGAVGDADRPNRVGKDAKAWTLIGTMDRVLWDAKQGVEAAFLCVRRLQLLYSNKGVVSKRLRLSVKSFAR